MKEKLTKNDSMHVKKSNSDLKRKNVQPDFDVYVASFEAFLKKAGAHKSYFEEWAKVNNYIGTANVFYAWKNLAKLIKPKNWIYGAFTWSESARGLYNWSTINSMWLTWLNQNIKK